MSGDVALASCWREERMGIDLLENPEDFVINR